MPAEVGVVAECEPISAEQFAQRVSTTAGLNSFSSREAAFVLSSVSTVRPGLPVGTNFVKVLGVSAAHEELRIHRVMIGG